MDEFMAYIPTELKGLGWTEGEVIRGSGKLPIKQLFRSGVKIQIQGSLIIVSNGERNSHMTEINFSGLNDKASNRYEIEGLMVGIANMLHSVALRTDRNIKKLPVGWRRKLIIPNDHISYQRQGKLIFQIRVAGNYGLDGISDRQVAYMLTKLPTYIANGLSPDHIAINASADGYVLKQILLGNRR